MTAEPMAKWMFIVIEIGFVLGMVLVSMNIASGNATHAGFFAGTTSICLICILNEILENYQ